MRLICLLAVLLVVTSCGKKGGSSSTGGEQREEVCANSDCSIFSDGTSVELLESVVDASVSISDSQILIHTSMTDMDQGDRLACKTEVKKGEIFYYSFAGDILTLQTSTGTYPMKRVNQGQSGLRGPFVWRGQENGMNVMKTITFISSNRILLRNNCEG